MTSSGAGGHEDSPPAVRAAGLRKRFGYREALRGVDLEIPATGCFLILGPNGAGKSTFLKILSTRMRPTSGKIEILGLDPRRQGEKLRASIGVVFHETFLRGELTLSENLRFYAELYGIPPSVTRERIEDLSVRMGLAPRLHDPVRTFSQGMAKRSTLIRSLLHDPRLWILDEPFSGLDPSGCGILSRIIDEERAGGRAVILVTHDIEEGLRLADDGAAIVDGAVAVRGREALVGFARSSPARPAASGGAA